MKIYGTFCMLTSVKKYQHCPILYLVQPVQAHSTCEVTGRWRPTLPLSVSFLRAAESWTDVEFVAKGYRTRAWFVVECFADRQRFMRNLTFSVTFCHSSKGRLLWTLAVPFFKKKQNKSTQRSVRFERPQYFVEKKMWYIKALKCSCHAS